jgi:hypothetical protein
MVARIAQPVSAGNQKLTIRKISTRRPRLA